MAGFIIRSFKPYCPAVALPSSKHDKVDLIFPAIHSLSTHGAGSCGSQKHRLVAGWPAYDCPTGLRSIICPGENGEGGGGDACMGGGRESGGITHIICQQFAALVTSLFRYIGSARTSFFKAYSIMALKAECEVSSQLADAPCSRA